MVKDHFTIRQKKKDHFTIQNELLILKQLNPKTSDKL